MAELQDKDIFEAIGGTICQTDRGRGWELVWEMGQAQINQIRIEAPTGVRAGE